MSARSLSAQTATQPALRDQLHVKRDQIGRVARRHGARNVRLFGSVARGVDRRTSDVDFLVDLEPGRSLLDLAALALDLEALIGRRVDVFTPEALKDRIRNEALSTAVPL
jgi:predicted nucleotidyltransferase